MKKNDWIYRLVFKRVHEVWTRAYRDVDRSNQRSKATEMPLEWLLIEQCAGADLSQSTCSEPVIRSWKYAGDGFEEQTAHTSLLLCKDTLTVTNEQKPLFFAQGTVRSHVSKDRKHLVVTYLFGPKYGHGLVYTIMGQGDSAELRTAPNTISWVA